jgi:2-isopropylmalate synthase
VAAAVKDSTVCSLARANDNDVKRAGEAVKGANRGRVHTFIATSPIHMKHKLRMEPDAVLEAAVRAVKLAREYTDDVEFSAEDAVRSEVDFLCRIFEAAIKAGARTINVPDTVGYSTPELWGGLFRTLMERVPNSGKAVWSTHCHDDLGMAVANSLTAVVAGARQIECTINGIGERAGNCSLEEVVMALATRSQFFNLQTGIQTNRLYPVSRLISNITGQPIPRNKAVIGENAFAHESGIHQHGMLQNRMTYEIMRPEDVGLTHSNLVLGKHSGRHAFRERVRELGFELDELELNRVFEEFKALADRKKELFDGDIEALVLRAEGSAHGPWSLAKLEVSSQLGAAASAAVRLQHADGRTPSGKASGDGPVDAAYKAIEQATGLAVKVRKFEVHAVTVGEDAQGETVVYVDYNDRSYRGSSVSTDIIEASCKALLEVVNRIEQSQQGGLRAAAKRELATGAKSAV